MKTNKKKTEQAKRLELLTLQYNLTTRDLANMIGLNENTLYKINCGKSEMSERTAARICYQMEKQKGVVVNREWLLRGEGAMIDEKSSVPYETEGVPASGMAAEPRLEEGTNYKEKYFALLEEFTGLQAEYNALLKKMLQQ